MALRARSRFSREFADFLEKNKKKNKNNVCLQASYHTIAFVIAKYPSTFTLTSI